MSKDQEHFTKEICPHSLFEGLTPLVAASYGIDLSFQVDPIVVRTKHGEKEENLMIHDSFFAIKTGRRYWLLSEGKRSEDSDGETLFNIIALPIKEPHEKEINRVIGRFEKTANAAELVVFSLEHPGAIQLNSDGKYARAEDEDIFHIQRDLVVASASSQHGQLLNEWEKKFKPGAIDFHAKYLAKLLQRSYRRH